MEHSAYLFHAHNQKKPVIFIPSSNPVLSTLPENTLSTLTKAKAEIILSQACERQSTELAFATSVDFTLKLEDDRNIDFVSEWSKVGAKLKLTKHDNMISREM